MNLVAQHRGAIFGAEPFRIPSTAMEPTLTPGDFITVDYRAGAMAKIERGDIVIFAPPHHPDQRWIKRVVGLPGERVDASGERVSIDGVPLRETWRTTPNVGASPGTYERITLGPDDYFLMGDNRPNSEDSRYTGPVERAAIQGKARTIWLHWMKPEGFDASRIGPIDPPAR
nr:signal peptidase I [Lysobacter gilvus]